VNRLQICTNFILLQKGEAETVTPSLSNDPLDLNSSPWIRRQVDTHLLFGSSKVFFWTVVVVYLVLLSCVELLAFTKNNPDWVISEDLFSYLKGGPIGLGIVLSLTAIKPSSYGWLLVKTLLLIVCFFLLAVGAPISFSKGQADAWVFLALGLIWLPSVEFFPLITLYQRYLTILRLILSLPAIYFGIRSGYWH